jgi:hypothetical protein
MIEKTAHALGRNDENPNIALAEELTAKEDAKGISEIVHGLGSADSSTAGDCIKVLYEIGYRKPRLIANHADVFIRLLHSRNNRLVWGAITALATITPVKPEMIYENLDTVRKAYEKGSVITVDASITVFAELGKAGEKYEKHIFPLLLQHLESCRPKEFALHAERTFICIHKKNADAFRIVLQKRYNALTDSQKKRLNKLFRKLDRKQYDA